MAVLVVTARLITRGLISDGPVSRWQAALELIVSTLVTQIEEVGLPRARRYLPFIGTLFLFVAAASLATVLPGYEPPTGSLSTTAALAFCVFIAVPFSASVSAACAAISARIWSRRRSCSVQPGQRTHPNPGAGRAAVRQHDERGDDSGDPTDRHAAPVSGRHERARPADRHGPGLHIQRAGGGLYRGHRNRAAQRALAAHLNRPTRQGKSMDSSLFIAIASIVTAGLTTAIGCIGPALAEGRAVAGAWHRSLSNPMRPRRSRARCLSAWR